eukprot:3068828-Pyramimonas_sp.AAC.1
MSDASTQRLLGRESEEERSSLIKWQNAALCQYPAPLRKPAPTAASLAESSLLNAQSDRTKPPG